jgi:hypothetical protein
MHEKDANGGGRGDRADTEQDSEDPKQTREAGAPLRADDPAIAGKMKRRPGLPSRPIDHVRATISLDIRTSRMTNRLTRGCAEAHRI